MQLPSFFNLNSNVIGGTSNAQQVEGDSKTFSEDNEKLFNQIIDVPRYFEEQEGFFCAKHALNNVLQQRLFVKEDFLASAEQLKQKDDLIHCYENGFFDTEVIEDVLTQKGIQSALVSSDTFDLYLNHNDVVSLVVTHKQHHYSARRFIINGNIWLFESLNQKPIVCNLLFDRLRREIEKSSVLDAPQLLVIFPNFNRLNEIGLEELQNKSISSQLNVLNVVLVACLLSRDHQNIMNA